MIDQIALGVTGVVAIFLSQSRQESYRKWACIFGLIGQPFWFYTTYIHEQWGVFALCFFYAAAWMKGLYTNWIKK